MLSASAQQHVPRDINAAADSVVKKWKQHPDVYTDEYLSSPFIFLGEGMGIRNSWIHGNRDTSLVNQFIRLGINNSHDMSSVVLTLAFRKRNHQPENFETLISETKRRIWDNKKYVSQIEEDMKAHLKSFENLKKGDSVRLYILVDSNCYSAQISLAWCKPLYVPEKKDATNRLNFIVDGVVENKLLFDSTMPCSTITLKIYWMNRNNVYAIDDKSEEGYLIQIGNKETFYLNNTLIDKF